MNGKSGQKGFFCTSTRMYVGRAMQEQLPSSFSILGQPPSQVAINNIAVLFTAIYLTLASQATAFLHKLLIIVKLKKLSVILLS